MPNIFTQRTPGQPDALNAWITSPKLENPLDEPVLDYFDSSDGIGEGFQLKAYTSDFKIIYPPTGVGEAWTMSAGLARSSRQPDLAFAALMKPAQGSGGGISAYKSAKYTPEYIAYRDEMKFWFQYADHVMYQGYPATQSAYWSQVISKQPMGLAYNEIIYKNATARETIERVCKIVNYYSRPPCNESYMFASLENNKKSNKATVVYNYQPDYLDHCNPNLYGAKKIPDPIANAPPSSFTASASTTGRAMIAICGFGILIQVILIVLFNLKWNEHVIKAAAHWPSMLIMSGSILTLGSVMMRVSFTEHLGWAQCFGTYWLFSIGYSRVLGSLAMKCYRVDRIFRNTKTNYSFSDTKVMLLIGFIISGDVLVSLMYQFWIVDDSKFQNVTIPMTGLTFQQVKCPTVHEIPTILYYVYNAGVLLISAVFAFRTRNVTSTYNENTFTAAAIGLICVVSIVIVPVLNLVTSSEAQLLLVGLGTFVATVLSTLIFAILKLLVAFKILKIKQSMPTISNIKGDRSSAPGD
ncbi:hypothetical protein HDV00_006883 [Rhizophlyctis rosea]|nr:hypothetical protein HDV00_006883 [Rhizophlyctis rosea]